jgi:hypothetical protein
MAIPLPTIDLLDSITVASPCDVSWREMRGDDRSRFCGKCQKNVFDLSAMTTAEALLLLGDKNNRPCIRLFRRADGRVMTADCPVGLRARTWRRLRRRASWLASLFAILSFQSCNTTWQGLVGDDVYKVVEYPLVFKEGPKKGKEVVVALYVDTAPGIGPQFADCGETLATDLAKKLPEMARVNKEKLLVLDPALVNTFKIKNPSWKQMPPREWGKMLGADFVLDIQIGKMSLYQPETRNKLYEGQADVTVDVYDVDSGFGDPKFEYILSYKYPRGLRAIDVGSIPQSRFKQDFLEHLATEICNKHVEHKLSSGIAAAE